ncbi:hypothetical protein [Mycolicibacterium sp. 120322]|uniref:hypothetical protein n=1 Tax=Mycolicibacterium sp. 120322 TaxID=3096109 RepID=UPI002EDAC407
MTLDNNSFGYPAVTIRRRREAVDVAVAPQSIAYRTSVGHSPNLQRRIELPTAATHSKVAANVYRVPAAGFPGEHGDPVPRSESVLPQRLSQRTPCSLIDRRVSAS